ncbi:MAG: hypothetical protein ACOC4M_11415 [Promethearchaeia archaeon]
MNFDNISVEQFNENFMEIIEDPSKIKEASVAGSNFVRMKLREEGVMRRYFGDLMDRVTTEDPRYQIDPNNSDTGYMLLDREPDSYALKMTMRGEPDSEYIQGDKWIVPFKKYMSPIFEKNEMELQNIRIPITEIIRQNVVLDMQQEEDDYFFKVIDAALDLTGNVHNSTNEHFQKDDLTKIFNMIDTERLESAAIIMARPTLNDAYRWDFTEVGSLIETVIEDGVEQLRLGGKRLITTSNTDVIKPGHIYVFAKPEFFGSAFSLNDPTFWMQKDKDLLRMSSWYYAGFNIGNIKSVAKLELADA